MLFVDDSGKPDPGHPSKAVVVGGFAIDSVDVATLSRRILGAKAKAFPGRGAPQTWELKAATFVKPNPWKRAKNRRFVGEVVRIVRGVGGTMFTATIDKGRMLHPMSLAHTMPLQLQCLVEHFEAECRALGATGVVVADWSAHQADAHASRCVASYVASRGLAMHPSVYYASSDATQAIQVADLVAGIRRRCVEGDAGLAALDADLRSVRRLTGAAVPLTFKGATFTNWIMVF